MAKKQSKKSKQQKRQAASERNRQRRAAQEAEQPQVPEVPTEPLSPGDRVNLILDALGQRIGQNPFVARAVACVIDYLLGGMLVMAPLVVAIQWVGDSSITRLTDFAGAGWGSLSIAGVLAMALFASYAYYVLIPWKLLPGKTPGKYLFKLEVVMLDGSPATLGELSVRWAFMTFVETVLTFASALIIQYVTLLCGDTAGNVYTMLGAAASAISAWRVWTSAPDRRALHDLVAGTWVYAEASAPKRKGKRSKASSGR